MIFDLEEDLEVGVDSDSDIDTDTESEDEDDMGSEYVLTDLNKDSFNSFISNWKCAVTKDSITIDTLIDKIDKGYKRTYGGIVLDPDYQREYKFSIKKESSIIESLILNIPIPVIYLSQNMQQDTVLFNVIDGMHRLKSIDRFVKNKYRLKGLKILKFLNGSNYDKLPSFIQNRLKYEAQIVINSIDVSNNSELEYNVFLRFNQESNPLTKQELLEVMYRSPFSHWLRNYLKDELSKNEDFKKIFNCTSNRLKNKTLLYSLYACLSYSHYGLREGKNDTPIYVSEYMKEMSEIESEYLEPMKASISKYIYGLVDFYSQISSMTGIDRIMSKEFITKKCPQGNHIFLMGFLIPLSMTYKYLCDKEIVPKLDSDEDYLTIYGAIINGMENIKFGDFGGVSSTSYKVQKECYDSIIKEIDLVIP